MAPLRSGAEMTGERWKSERHVARVPTARAAVNTPEGSLERALPMPCDSRWS